MFDQEIAGSQRSFDDLAIGISTYDLSGRFLSASRTFCAMTGYTEQELTDRDEWIITHPDDVPQSRRAFEGLVADETRGAVHEKRYLRKNGEIIWVRNSFSVVYDSDGRAVKTIALTEDITVRRNAEVAIGRARRQLRWLSMELLRSQERERRRFARELHDGPAQLLAGLSINLKRLRETNLDESRKLRLLAEAIELAGECSREVRTLSFELHPPEVEQLGLGAALESFVEGFRRRAGLDIELSIAPALRRLDGDIATAIFRIVQEGLANVRKHSGSPVASVKLRSDAREVHLELRDRGRGLHAGEHCDLNGAVRVGVGIRGMYERVELLGGRLEITFGEDGTCLRASLPLPGVNEEAANPCR